MFRRLLLAAMNLQLSRGNAALKGLFESEPGGSAVPSTRELGKVSGMLEGWHPQDG
jgi:hypothetical protein